MNNDLAAEILAQKLVDTFYNTTYDTIKKAGLWDEFIEFNKKFGSAPLCTIDMIKEFCSLHPDKLFCPDPREYKGHFVMIDRRVEK